MGFKLNRSARCAVIGYGSWATAIVKILHEREGRVGWFVREPEDLEYIRANKTNPYYLRDVHLNLKRLFLSSTIDEVVREAEIIILCVPSAYLKTHLEGLTASLADKFIVSAVKGIIPGDNVTVAEYVHSRYDVPFERIGIVTGPCHAEEVALERLSYLTMVGKSESNARILAEKFRTRYISVTCSQDIYGAEYASVLKNIYAIDVGIAVGLGYGDNFISVLICNAAEEMSRFIERSFPGGRDITASAYLGDLLVTCYSQFSRNRTFGAMIGKGYSVSSAQAEMRMVAEGYYGAEGIHEINLALGVELPIADAVHKILYRSAPPATTMKELTLKLK
jgi:glycerol-3-phosphate dehydrogenase (NAD(P)+)